MPADASTPSRRRWGLYLPVVLLGLLVVAWSGGWFFVRERVKSGLDEWIGKEATAGRRWTCADRSITGYPFRIEIRCADFTVERPDVRASIGPLLVVAQVYRPRHVIAEAKGPLNLTAGPNRVEGGWKLLQASVLTAPGGFDLLSIVADEPAVSVSQPGRASVDLSSKRFEGHLRPHPGERTTMDLAWTSKAAVIPGLNEILGGAEPVDTEVQLSITQTDDLPARPLLAELERWRAAGGRATLSKLVVVKGRQRIEGVGLFGIDAEHRPEGVLDLQAAGLGGLLGQLAGGGGSLLGAILGGGRPPEEKADGRLRRLPQVRLSGGRVMLGPLPIPGLRVPPLY
ncbi:DUF2125 domain-containing protein [Enterovirga rhinocerotis]|uniref:DUF2125 domain-containing protein n=1 Tax=Enterovirga rhinocerotis TaxID=1339210 RepID=A0A4R7C6P3_9HYPH|nr:DUF2125 domain-containing protein [Enterovirga rhinocerotis]TDR93612.1 hypothetical protein EV668_0877 [Enterovirga rhinocerotis]